jgi:hypothetical protein
MSPIDVLAACEQNSIWIHLTRPNFQFINFLCYIKYWSTYLFEHPILPGIPAGLPFCASKGAGRLKSGKNKVRRVAEDSPSLWIWNNATIFDLYICAIKIIRCLFISTAASFNLKFYLATAELRKSRVFSAITIILTWWFKDPMQRMH